MITTVLNFLYTIPRPPGILVVSSVSLFIYGIIYIIMTDAKKASNALRSKKYRKNPKGSMLTSAQQIALNIGAVNSEQTMYFSDSLKTGDNINTIRTNLLTYYGIKSKKTAKEILTWLQMDGHSVYYDALVKSFVNGDINDWKAKVKESFDDEESIVKCNEFMFNLEGTISLLIERKYITDRQNLNDISILAWDMGRLVNITRGCLDCRYINQEEAWEFINSAYAQSAEKYSSWREFAVGYIVGRAMWLGHSMTLEPIMDITDGLLNDEDSPWKVRNIK